MEGESNDIFIYWETVRQQAIEELDKEIERMRLFDKKLKNDFNSDMIDDIILHESSEVTAMNALRNAAENINKSFGN